VLGNPARVHRYVPNPGAEDASPPATEAVATWSGAPEVELIRVPFKRTSITGWDDPDSTPGLPFSPACCDVTYDVPPPEVRGEYAHQRCSQLLICARGSVLVTCDDGRRRSEFVLDDPTLGLHLAPMIWCSQHHFSPDAVLLVLASHALGPADCIRDYNLFAAARRHAER
jgi:hypothetical protein